MQHVIQRSIVITLEIVPSGVTKHTEEQTTAAIASAWLQYIAQRIEIPSRPVSQVYMRLLPLDHGAQIQILVYWIVLQAHRQELNDFDRSI